VDTLHSVFRTFFLMSQNPLVCQNATAVINDADLDSGTTNINSCVEREFALRC